MDFVPEISTTAAVLADVTRARILTQLLSGQALTAGELAREAEVSPQTASNHLSQLLTAGFIQVEAQGRHRYFRLANCEVAQLLEALIAFEHRRVNIRVSQTPTRLRFARRCYDHLAGELGVLLFDGLKQQRLIVELSDSFTLAPSGEAWLSAFGVDVQTLKRKRRALLRPCLDWSERRPHLAGAVGAALLGQFLDRRWLLAGQYRELHLTPLGQQELEHRLNLRLQQVAGYCQI